MSIPGAFIKGSVAFVLTSVTFFTTSAYGQSPAAPRNSTVAVSDAAPQTGAAAPTNDDRYRDGTVIWETPAGAKVPFLLKFNLNTQLRYLNTLSTDETFTDHLGGVGEVHRRHDITVNRAMFILGGYIFDERLRYSFTVWTSAGAASIVIASNIGWQFNKALTITGGYTGVPGSRSLVNTFPFFQAIDRTMADNFFRPGFTQGAWANGEPLKNLHYLAFVGNGLVALDRQNRASSVTLRSALPVVVDNTRIDFIDENALVTAIGRMTSRYFPRTVAGHRPRSTAAAF